MHCRALRTPFAVQVPIAASKSKCLPPKVLINQSSSSRVLSRSGLQRPPRGGTRAASSGDEESQPSTPLEYELGVIQDARDSTIDRWRDMYDQQAQSAVAAGLPKSAVPELPQRPTRQDIAKAAEMLGRIMQSFESAAL